MRKSMAQKRVEMRIVDVIRDAKEWHEVYTNRDNPSRRTELWSAEEQLQRSVAALLKAAADWS